MFVILRRDVPAELLKERTEVMPIFFLMMVVGGLGIVYLAFKDVESAPWNKWMNRGKKS